MHESQNGSQNQDGPAGPRSVVVRLDQVKPSKVRWLWPGRVPRGKLTVISGDPGLGKSFITLDMAARASRRDDWPDCAWPDDDWDDRPPHMARAPVGSVFCSAEDDPWDTLRPRLDALGADVSRIGFVHSVSSPGVRKKQELRLDLHTEALAHAIDSVPNCGLVVIDPISAFMGKCDSNNNAEVRALLRPLSDLARAKGVAIVCVSHLNKSGQGRAVYRTMGSLAFNAAARVVHMVVADPDKPERRVMAPVKCNIARMPKGLAYRLEELDEGTGIVWTETDVDTPAETLDNAEAHERRTAADEAESWLRQELAEGPRASKELLEQASELGMGKRSIADARRRLGVKATRDGGRNGQWVLSL